jgi:hypothetical protein
LALRVRSKASSEERVHSQSAVDALNVIESADASRNNLKDHAHIVIAAWTSRLQYLVSHSSRCTWLSEVRQPHESYQNYNLLLMRATRWFVRL